jgi:twitching motility protein PilT
MAKDIIKTLLKKADEDYASELQFKHGEPARYKIQECWMDIDEKKYFSIEIQDMCWQMLDPRKQNEFFLRSKTTFVVSLDNGKDYEGIMTKSMGGVEVIFKPVLPTAAPSAPAIQQAPPPAPRPAPPMIQQAPPAPAAPVHPTAPIRPAVPQPQPTQMAAQPQRPQSVTPPAAQPKSVESSTDIVDIYQQKTFQTLKSSYPFSITRLLGEAFKQGASDIHLGVGLPPIFRVSGEMGRTKYPKLQPNHMIDLVQQSFKPGMMDRLEEARELDYSFEIPGMCRFRGNVLFERGNIGAVYRIIPTKILTLDELKAPEIFKTITQKKRGLVVVTGPTGSGKSTTLAAMIDHINNSRAEHIITVEDPIEFVHQSRKSKITHREVGTDTKSFSEGLKRALRQDPDIILVGEMRDLETIALAITASETGHLVFGTLHTSSAAKTINRIIDVFPTHQQAQIRSMLSEGLYAVIAQQLLRTKTGGRVACHEIMLNLSSIANLIREEKIFQIPTIMVTSRKLGMITNDQNLFRLIQEGVISEQVALAHAHFPKVLTEQLRKKAEEYVPPEPTENQPQAPGSPQRPA